MAYSFVLTVHSWLRWIVLGLGLFCAARGILSRRSGRPYERLDDRLGLAFVAALDLQVTLGIFMYLFLSPMTSLAFQDVGAAMRSSTLRFFLIEHAFSMLLALACAHIFRVRARRATAATDKHKRAALGAGLASLCLIVGIPWPFMPYPRPLFRVSVEGNSAPAAAKDEFAEARELYQTRCTPCHGASGRGDGAAAPNLVPRPRDFHDPAWQRGATDAAIEAIIKRGGHAMGKSPMMPPNPDLDDAKVRALRAYVRELGR